MYNYYNFIYHANNIRANLDKILGPNLNLVPLDHIGNINYIFYMPQGINSLQELFASRGDIYYI